MTIKVQIANEDTTRILEVTQLEYERGQFSALSYPRDIVQLGPGESRTFYVHLLRELRVTEKTP